MRRLKRIATAVVGLTLVAMVVPGVAHAAGPTATTRADAAEAAVTADLKAALARADAANPPRAEAAAAADKVCYQAHVQNIGTQTLVCQGDVAGTEGQGLRMEAISIWINVGVGNICYSVHVQDIGWMPARCNMEFAGTIGEGRRIEAIRIVRDAGGVCYSAHVQNVGWQGVRCNNEVAGTEGQGLRMEALRIAI